MDKFKVLLAGAKDRLLHLLFPRTCFHCRVDMARGDKNLLCPACLKELKFITGLVCRRCGLPLKDGGALCFACRKRRSKRFKCSFIRSGLEFTPVSRSLVHAFKYEKYIHIASFFAPLLYKTWQNNPEFFEADLLVPVPIHKSRLRSRGFNQALLLARGLSGLCGVPVADVLARCAKTKSQTALGRQARAANVKGAFVCLDKAAVKGRAVVLIDDVCTTSATMEECAIVLKSAGAREVLGISALRE
ncbi:MAG: ComF family protein [Elusimicrobiota bacterium]|jgi:ComF family protein|nr:ComF family protein [Elusimicrobiota bacterium]